MHILSLLRRCNYGKRLGALNLLDAHETCQGCPGLLPSDGCLSGIHESCLLSCICHRLSQRQKPFHRPHAGGSPLHYHSHIAAKP